MPVQIRISDTVVLDSAAWSHPANGLTIDHATLEEWADRPVSPEDLARLDQTPAHSSVPGALATIHDFFDNREDHDA